MPTYEYKCKNCSHLFEQFQSMKDAPLRKCPECGKNALERLIGTGAAILFKGSGFYQTDYRTESYKAGEKAASGAASGGSSSGGEAKPADAAPKTEAKTAVAPSATAAPSAKSDKPAKSKPKG
jgi:putative FmdB family regulatory protein